MTQQWPHEPVEFAGKRVAVIGTGSSGIQAIPVIAEEALHVTVFQRTPNFSVPGHNHPLSAEQMAAHKASYPEHRAIQRKSHGAVVLDVNRRRSTEMSDEELRDELERRWAVGGAMTFSVCFRDLMIDLEANEIAQDFIRDKIRSKVRDPQVADLLCPTDHPYGTKRPCVDHGYFETFNRDNVTLVSVRDNPITRITATGVMLDDGTTYHVDTIVFAPATTPSPAR
jgi:cyclohexanone monooxygenase